MLSVISKKYTEAGWSVLVCPRGSPMELIAVKAEKMHFIRTTPPDSNGAYIQNAFSNLADPIIVSGTIDAPIITNINIQSRVQLRQVKRK